MSLADKVKDAVGLGHGSSTPTGRKCQTHAL